MKLYWVFAASIALFICFASQNTVRSEETIAKLNERSFQCGGGHIGQMHIPSGACWAMENAWTTADKNTSNFKKAHSFIVYTKEDLDKIFVEYSRRIDTLSNNVKALSDMNDSLTRRLNELEEKVEKHGSG